MSPAGRPLPASTTSAGQAAVEPPAGAGAATDVRATPPVLPPRPRTGGAEREPRRAGEDEISRLFRTLRSVPAGSSAHRASRDELVHRHLSLVHFLARRFRHRGETLPDLVQVATIGLIKAIDRFDDTRGIEFGAFATPTIVGEIKRHFRDRAWAIRVPRRLLDQQSSVAAAATELSQRLGRSPTVAEIAANAGLSEEETLDCLESTYAYSTVSLDAVSANSTDRYAPLLDALGSTDAGIEEVERREALRPLLARLPDRERRILILRFFRGLTQAEIATEVGISQMHVSRLLTRTLTSLRRGLQDERA